MYSIHTEPHTGRFLLYARISGRTKRRAELSPVLVTTVAPQI